MASAADAGRDRFLEEYHRFQSTQGWIVFALSVSMPVVVFLTYTVSPYAVFGFIAVTLVWLPAFWLGQRRWTRVKYGFWVDVNSLSVFRLALFTLIGGAIGILGTLLVVLEGTPEPRRTASFPFGLVAMAVAILLADFPILLLVDRYRQRRFKDVQVRFVPSGKQAVIAALGATIGASGAPFRFDERGKVGFFMWPTFFVAEGALQYTILGTKPRESSVYRVATSPSPHGGIEVAVDGALARLGQVPS